MTWSIVAHDAATGAFAVAVATRAFAVGATCPFVRAGVGAVSTQSLSNRYLGPAILDGMARGLPPEAAIEGALVGDAGKHLRQVHAIDRHGQAAAWTGANCVMWCGSASGAQASVAGNMLAGEAVVSDTLAAMDQSGTLAERLMRSMRAGESAGGDRRGKQSAAIVVVTTEDFPDLNLRVDDHPEPLDELERLLGLWHREAAPALATRPRRADPAGVIDLDSIEAAWAARGLDLRLRRPGR